MKHNNINFFIKNINLPICTKCIHYRFSNNPSIGICVKFAEKNIVTGKIIYKNALYIRSKKCGINAIYFEPHNYDN